MNLRRDGFSETMDYTKNRRNYDSLRTDDIPGAKPKNLKYKDRGKRKMNFYPNDTQHKFLNEYYNKESVGGSLGNNSVTYNYDENIIIEDPPTFPSFDKHLSIKEHRS